MHLARALITGLSLLVASTALVMVGDEATDPVVIVGVVGIVLAASLLALTALAARWRVGDVHFVTSRVDLPLGAPASIGDAFDDVSVPQQQPALHEGSAAV